MLRITTNAAAYSRRVRACALEIQREQVRAAKDIANRLTGESREQLIIDIYAVPIKRSPTGRPLWTRLFNKPGGLLGEETWVPKGTDVRHRNLSPHYIHRWRYGKAGGRPARPPQRASSWHRVALIRNARWINQRRHIALRRALRHGISR